MIGFEDFGGSRCVPVGLWNLEIDMFEFMIDQRSRIRKEERIVEMRQRIQGNIYIYLFYFLEND